MEGARFVVVAVNDDGVNISPPSSRGTSPLLQGIPCPGERPGLRGEALQGGSGLRRPPPHHRRAGHSRDRPPDIVRVLVDLPNGRKVLMKHLTRHAGTTARDWRGGRACASQVQGPDGPWSGPVPESPSTKGTR